MATEILAVGTSAATTSWTAAASGIVVQLMMTPPVGTESNHPENQVYLQFKRAAGGGVTVQTLNGTNPVSARFEGPLEYRIVRPVLPTRTGGAGVEVL